MVCGLDWTRINADENGFSQKIKNAVQSVRKTQLRELPFKWIK